MLKHHHSNALNLHCLFLEKLTSKQRLKVKSSIIDTNSCLNRILPLFNSLHKKLTPGFWLVDIFSNHFSFNIAECKINDYKAAHLWKLDNIFKDSLYDTKIVIIISDASIKNNIAMSIAHVHSGENIVAKTIHYAVNVILTEAELFVIKYGINQTIQVNYFMHYNCYWCYPFSKTYIWFIILFLSNPVHYYSSRSQILLWKECP